MRVIPSERLLPNSEGTPLPDSHDELPPVIRRAELVAFALVALLLICVMAVLYVARAFFLPLTMAFVVGTMLSPAAGVLERWRIPRAVGAVLIVVAVTAVVGVVVVLISAPVLEWSTRMPELVAHLKDRLQSLGRLAVWWQELQALAGGGSSTGAGWEMPKIEWVQPTLEFVTPTLTEFLLFFATLILFIASWRDLRRTLIMTFGERESRLRTLRILNEMEVHLGNYLLLVSLINIGVGVATGLICLVTGMPRPAGLGALAAVLNFLPIIGPIFTFVVLTVVGIVSFPDLGSGMLAPMAFGVLAFLEGHFITPTIIGRRLALNALAVFVALAFWTWLWGPMGAFIASPLLIVGLILKEHLLPDDSPQLPHE